MPLSGPCNRSPSHAHNRLATYNTLRPSISAALALTAVSNANAADDLVPHASAKRGQLCGDRYKVIIEGKNDGFSASGGT